MADDESAQDILDFIHRKRTEDQPEGYLSRIKSALVGRSGEAEASGPPAPVSTERTAADDIGFGGSANYLSSLRRFQRDTGRGPGGSREGDPIPERVDAHLFTQAFPGKPSAQVREEVERRVKGKGQIFWKE